jgi:hypothetical protein
MNKNTKFMTFIIKTGVPIYLTLISILNLIENWEIWPTWRKIGLFIFVPILFLIFWIKGDKKEKQ